LEKEVKERAKRKVVEQKDEGMKQIRKEEEEEEEEEGKQQQQQ